MLSAVINKTKLKTQQLILHKQVFIQSCPDRDGAQVPDQLLLAAVHLTGQGVEQVDANPLYKLLTLGRPHHAQ